MTESHVRELHNLTLIDTGDGIEASLHLKLPGDLPLAGCARDRRGSRGRNPSRRAGGQGRPHPSRAARQPAPGRVVSHDAAEIERAVESVTGRRPRGLRTLVTNDGLVVLVTLGLEGGVSLAEAHNEATAVSERIRAALPGVADVVVHTEP